MTEPFIRKARPGEEKEIHAVHMRSINEICIHSHGPEEIRGWGNRPLGDRWVEPITMGNVWVIENDLQICGLGYLLPKTSETGEVISTLHALYLSPEAIGQGLGRNLAKTLIDSAKAHNSVRIELNSSLNAHGFYLKLGFVTVGELQRQEIAGFKVSYYPMRMNLIF